MNSDDRFIRQLESYLDDYEGATTLPERVRAEVRAALPRTKQTGVVAGPVRYLSMTMNKIGPVALAAVAGLLAIAAGIYLFGGRDVGDPTATPSTSPSTPASAAESAPPSDRADMCSQTTVRATGTAGVTHEFAWCSARTSGENVPISFTMDVPPEWDYEWYGDVESLWLRPEGGGAILFAVHPDQPVDELLEDVRGRDGYTVSNAVDVNLDGAAGVAFDVTLAEGASAGDTEPLFETPQQPWLLSDGVQRVWIVDHDGETIMIAAGEQLVEDVQAALSTLAWGD
jgi:hypothetical protein